MNITVSQQEYKINPLIKGVMDENNPLMLEVLNYLIYLKHHFGAVFPSQGTIAARFKVSRQWVNALLAEWKSKGIIQYRQQGFNRSCVYAINPILFQDRERLKYKLSALKLILHISFLFSGVFGDELTLSNIRNLYSNKYQMVEVRNEGYHWYEVGYGEISKHLFINNKQTPTSIGHQPLEGESIMNKSVINLIADTYGLSVDQEARLNNCSTEGLEYAVKEFSRQKQTTTINNPVNWIAKVAAAYKGNAPRFPKNGKEVGHSAQSRNAGGHSPAGDASNLSHEERIQFALYEESAWSEIFEPTPALEVLGIHEGYAQRAQANWKRIAQTPQEFPTSSNSFKDTLDAGEQYTEGEEYEEHLNQISIGKTDPEAYKRRTRITDYRRIARK